MKKLRNSAILLFIAAFAATAANIGILSFRDDGEKIAVVKDVDKAIFTFSEPAKISLFVCLPDAEASKLIEHQPIKTIQNRTLDVLQMSKPRPLDIPMLFAQNHGIEEHVMCTVSPMFHVTPDAQAQMAIFDAQIHEPEMLPGVVDLKISDAISIPAPENALVVAAVSSSQSTWLETLLFFVFFAALAMAGVQSAKYWWQTDRQNKPEMLAGLRFYDAPITFFGALILSVLLSSFIGTFFNTETSTLLPGFGQMAVMLAANFTAFLLMAGIYFIIDQNKTKHLKNASDVPSASSDKITPCSDQECQCSDKETPSHTSESVQTWKERITNLFLRPDVPTAFPIYIPFVLGGGLSLLAILSVLFAPIPGLSTVEMASQLTSTCLLTAHFAVLAGVSEECLFRGIIQSSMEARRGSKHPACINAIAILITTVLFVSVHVPQSVDHLWALIPIGTVSLVAGWLKLHYRSIFPAILLHMTYNTILLLPSVLV